MGGASIPAVFYNWQPFSPACPVQIAAGLGFDITHLVITLGAGHTFHDNISVSLGLATFEGDRLKSQYSQGVHVASGVQQADLFEKRFYARPYAAVAFRFASNPFSAPKTDSKTTDAKPATPKPPTPTPSK
jgi:hypothetical protein